VLILAFNIQVHFLSGEVMTFMTMQVLTGAVDERVLSRHRKLAQTPEARLEQDVLQALRYELDLPPDERRRRTLDRFRAWLLLDRPSARRLAGAFARASACLEPSEQQTLTETEEDAVLDGLSFAEFRELCGFVPSLAKWRLVTEGELLPGPLPASLAAALAFSSAA
jgi:hypothetical protein